jgi:hypothetical protein
MFTHCPAREKLLLRRTMGPVNKDFFAHFSAMPGPGLAKTLLFLKTNQRGVLYCFFGFFGFIGVLGFFFGFFKFSSYHRHIFADIWSLFLY